MWQCILGFGILCLYHRVRVSIRKRVARWCICWKNCFERANSLVAVASLFVSVFAKQTVKWIAPAQTLAYSFCCVSCTTSANKYVGSCECVHVYDMTRATHGSFRLTAWHTVLVMDGQVWQVAYRVSGTRTNAHTAGEERNVSMVVDKFSGYFWSSSWLCRHMNIIKKLEKPLGYYWR